MVGLLLVLCGLASPLDEATAAAQLAAAEHDFARAGRPATERRLTALAEEWPTTIAGARALVWRGELYVEDRDLPAAKASFLLARSRVPEGELAALAARDLGNVALIERQWQEAIARFDEAARSAPPALTDELRQRKAFAINEVRRDRWELGAWLILLVVVARFVGAAILARRSLGWPREVTFVAPLYALLAVAALRVVPAARATILYAGLGSLALLGLAFAPRHDVRRRGRAILDGALLLLATSAILYVASRRAGLLDALGTTFEEGVLIR